ncbi:BTAD domain-containing putative transcriptional regulator [Nonomuraea angiospora]|uniref:AfsR/SARP family transcriptional regulator n=1 Tax=Nonomuraea angiospora TaxID=46172 RepID=UPI0037A4F200
MTGEMAVPPGARPVLRLFGPVEVGEQEKRWSLGPPQEQRLLVALVLAEGNPVGLAMIEEWVWDGVESEKDRSDAIHKLASNLRRSLRRAGILAELPRAGMAYRLNVDDDLVDVRRFRADVKSAAHLMAEGEEHQAAQALADALGWCRGVPFAALPGPLIDGVRARLTREVQDARLLLSEVEIRQGRHRPQVDPLVGLLTEDPGNTRATWLLMHAYYREGRLDLVQQVQGQANAYAREETATDVQELRELGQRMYDADPTLLSPEAVVFPREGPPRYASTTITRVDRVDDPEDDAASRGSATDDEAAQSQDGQAQPSVDPASSARDTVINLGKRVKSFHADTMYFGKQS